MKYIPIIYLLVTFSSCKQEIPDVKKDAEMQRFGEEQFKKLSSLKKLTAKTMIDYFGEPPRTIEILHAHHYLYLESDAVGYIFEIEAGGTNIFNNPPDQIVISAIRRYPQCDMIWQSSDYQEKLKRRGMQADLRFKEEQLNKLSSLKKLTAKTMVDYFGEPLNLDSFFYDPSKDPFVDPNDKASNNLKLSEIASFQYLGSNDRAYYFEILEESNSSKDLEQVVITSVHRYNKYELIWQSAEEQKKQKLREEHFKKLTGLKKLTAKTMIDYFGKPMNLDGSLTSVEFKQGIHYIYSEPNGDGYYFEVQKDTFPNENLNEVLITTIRTYPGFVVIWQSQDKKEKQRLENK